MAGLIISFKAQGFDEAKARVAELKKSSRIRAAVKAAAEHMKGKISQYPPASEANSPSRGRWYERGYGPKWSTKNGVHGRKTSETLGRKWTVKTLEGGLAAEVGNNVSYSPYVHDDDKQASFHAARGWKTLEQIIKQEQKKVVRMVTKIVESEIRRILGQS